MIRALSIATALAFSSYGCVGDSPVDLSSLSKPVTANAAYQVQNGDFEIAGCTSWSPAEATFADATGALVRSGAHACMVCSDGKSTTSVYGVSQRVSVTNLKAGATYRAVVYARAPGSDKKTATGLSASLFVDTGSDGETIIDSIDTTFPKLTDQYQAATTSAIRFETRPRAKDLVIQVVNRGTDGGCFVIDDIAVTEQP